LYDRSPGGTTEQAAVVRESSAIARPRACSLGWSHHPGVPRRFVLSRRPACRAVSGWRAAGKRARTRLGDGLHLARFSRPYRTHVLYNAAYPALKRWATFVASLPGRGRDRPATSASVECYERWSSGWWVARGISPGEHESSGDSPPPPLKRWGTRKLVRTADPTRCVAPVSNRCPVPCGTGFQPVSRVASPIRLPHR
jgi:hypothetical protein